VFELHNYNIWRHGPAVTDEPARCAASQQTCCKHRWMLTVINLPPN